MLRVTGGLLPPSSSRTTYTDCIPRILTRRRRPRIVPAQPVQTHPPPQARRTSTGTHAIRASPSTDPWHGSPCHPLAAPTPCQSLGRLGVPVHSNTAARGMCIYMDLCHHVHSVPFRFSSFIPRSLATTTCTIPFFLHFFISLETCAPRSFKGAKTCTRYPCFTSHAIRFFGIDCRNTFPNILSPLLQQPTTPTS